MQGGYLMLCFLGAVVLCSCTVAGQFCDAESGDCDSEYDVSKISSKLLESFLWNGNEQFQQVFPLLVEVQAIADEILLFDVNDILKIEKDLHSTFHRLYNGTLEVGIIGLQKAGKSTFLNALLAKRFIPTSVEVVQAVDITIVHDASKSNGSLYCATGEEMLLLAEGETEIYDELQSRNKELASDIGPVGCDKLILRAPMKFLMGSSIQDFKVQFADTQGFGEVLGKNVAEIKEMSAFILILNSEYMGSDSEAAMLKDLVTSHPGIFSKLNRVLFLVNGREGIYRAGSSSNSKSVTPKGIPEYVSKYLQTKDFLNLDEELSPEKVVLFNALWALNCRHQDTWSKILFDEALLMLRYNKIHFQEDSHKEINAKDIKDMCNLLEPISAIAEVERRIRQMVIENGPKILLESVVDDTIRIINEDFIPVLDDLMAKENVAGKNAVVNSFNKLISLIENGLKEGGKEFDSISTSSVRSFISQNHDKVRDAIVSTVSTTVSGLQTSKQDKTDGIIGGMKSIRNAVPSAVKTKTRGDWNTITQNIRDSLVRQGQDFLRKIRDHFTAKVSQWSAGESANVDSIVADSASVFIKSFKDSDTSLSISSVSGSFPLENIVINANTLTDSALGNYVQTSTEQKYKSVQRKRCKRKWGRKKCKKYYEHEPYNVQVYAPIVSSFRAAFDGSIQDWVVQYDRHVESYSQEVSRAVANSGREKLTLMFNQPLKMVVEILESSKKAWSQSVENVQILDNQKTKLVDLVTKLKEVSG